jgi:hypothetical protein
MSKRDYSPSMGVHYTEAQLDAAADAYLASRPGGQMHAAIGRVEVDALAAHAKAIRANKRAIDRAQDETAAQIMREFGAGHPN